MISYTLCVFCKGNDTEYLDADFTVTQPDGTCTYYFGTGYIKQDGPQYAVSPGQTPVQSPPQYFYYTKDHLGSNHVVLNGSGTLKQQIHYYPSGWPMSKLSALAYQRYMFQGKEFDMMHGLRWHDHGARFADNTILRWTTMDPLCEKYYDTSPYVFCGNSFLNQFDPDGKVPIRLISSAAKYIRKAYQLYRKTGRLSPNNLKNAGISDLIDVADDLITIFDGGSSTFDKIKAGADLVIGTDFNTTLHKTIVR